MRLSVVCLIVVILWGVFDIFLGIGAGSEYNQQIESEWDLADKSSTIEEKSKHIDLFVESLESAGLKGRYNASFYRNPSNSFDKNLEALKTLQTRLREIVKMDPTSLAYQTAIHQITQQEQGEAKEMLSVFEGCWYHENHLLYWGWVFILNVLLTIIAIFGCVVWTIETSSF